MLVKKGLIQKAKTQDLATTELYEDNTKGCYQVLFLNTCADGDTLPYAERIGLRRRGMFVGRNKFILEHTEFEVLLQEQDMPI